MKLFKLKYPKLIGLLIAILLAYFIFRNPAVSDFVSHLGNWRYLGILIAGMLFAFGFTAPFAAGFFITLTPQNLWLAGIIGGCGALISDLIIFKFIRFSFEREFSDLKKTKTVKKTQKLIEKNIGKKIGIYLMYSLAGIMIASPLPDEAGIIMLAGLTKIKIKTMIKISFALNTLGILILLAL